MRKNVLRCFVMLICLLSVLVSGCSMRNQPDGSYQPGSDQSQTGSHGSGSQNEPTPGTDDNIQPTDQPMNPATGSDINVPNPDNTDQPEGYSGPQLQLREKVEDDFFDDAVFFGNSLINGLELYGQMKGGDFCAATSASVISVTSTLNVTLKNGSIGTLLDKMLEKQYGKIYILLGINEIGFNTDYFAELYSDMLSRIEEIQPEATIYIMSLSPVTKAKSDAGAPFTMDRIREYNQTLYSLAQEHECYYIDLVDALADSSGYLPAADSTDGVHFVVSKYPVWADYLRTHYAGDADDVKSFESEDVVYVAPDQGSGEPNGEDTDPGEDETEETPQPGTGTDIVIDN